MKETNKKIQRFWSLMAALSLIVFFIAGCGEREQIENNTSLQENRSLQTFHSADKQSSAKGTDPEEIEILTSKPITTEQVITQMAGEETRTEAPETEPMSVGPSEPEYPVVASVRLMAVGDNLMHLSNSLSGKQPDGSFDFTYHFQHVAPMIQQADIAVINQECVMGGAELGIQTYPTFNTVFDVGHSMVNAGFDVVLGANNHILDQDEMGLQNMIHFWKTAYPQISLLGIHDTQEDSGKIAVIEKNGIRLAMLNYTYGTNVTDAADRKPYLVDYLRPEKMEADIKKAKEMSDFVIVFTHWGEEYNDTPTPEVQELTRKMASWGVDLVIGSHPHVVEPVNWVVRENDKPMLVYYSLGNFQSEQFRTEHMLGGLADITIVKDESKDTYVLNHSMQYLVTHYQLTIPDLGYYNIVTTYPWEQYTPELAASHGIISKDPTFSYDKLNQIRMNMVQRCQ